MKHFFLWAVAISALCSSCETADESFSKNNNIPQEVFTTQQRKGNYYDVYKSVINSFTYNDQLLHYNNLLQFQEHVNDIVPNSTVAEAIDFTQLNVLENADEEFIDELNYSIEAKIAITAILNGTFNADMLTLISNTHEHDLINTLYTIHSNGNGDDDDEHWRDRKIIAFAYGFQNNITQAVLYAGAIDLMKYA